MSTVVPPQAQQRSPSRGWLSRLILPGAIVFALALVGVAAWQTGAAPLAVDAGAASAPPPLALPSDIAVDAPVARAAAQLAAGENERARAGFVDVVAKSPDDLPGQVGLALVRWSSTGPASSEAALRQLAREHPESAFVALHLGLVQSLTGEPRVARVTLRGAVELGRAAGDATSLRMASLAENVLVPGAFRGAMPVLVRASEVAADDRAVLRRLLSAVERGDLLAARQLALDIGDATDPMLQVAAVAATFDKQSGGAVAARLDELARQPASPARVRDRARLQAAIARLWQGDDRAAGCRELASLSGVAVDAATRSIAKPIRAELCS